MNNYIEEQLLLAASEKDEIVQFRSVVCSEFNHSIFIIMVRVKRIIFNFFEFF